MEIRLKIENSPSKEEEKKILDKLWDTYRTAAPDSYLVNLFSQEFINWCHVQINNDFTCDAYEFIKGSQELMDMKPDLDDAQERVVDLDRSLRALESDYEDLKKERETLVERVNEQKEEREGLHSMLLKEAKEKNQIISGLEEERNTLQDENFGFQELNEQMEMKIMGLKADLYDLMKKN